MDFTKRYQTEWTEYDGMERDFIDDAAIWRILHRWEHPGPEDVRRVLAKSARQIRLDPEEMAVLLQNQDPETIREMYALANRLKREVYGDRIVFFAPLYISDECVNNCLYCGYRDANRTIRRKTLNMAEIAREVSIMINEGQKRTIVVYGESPQTNIDYICDSIRQVYAVKNNRGAIRRANVNGYPMTREEFQRLKQVGIGTFQVFQETYHHDTYRRVHPANTLKGHYRWRLYSHDRAMAAGIDDVGIGALFGLYDWRFEAMGLLCHTIHLETKFNGVGPHTISFPRIEPALDTPFAAHPEYAVSDADFKKLVAVMRLAVPYTGLILTAREKPEVRREVIPLGISQIDAGTRIGVGGYQQSAGNAMPDKEQFQLGDTRSLDEVIRETCRDSIPSLCTGCYRAGRTGEHFMGLAKSSFVHNYCIPNAICTFKEYLLDYASPETRAVGEPLLQKYLDQLTKPETRTFVEKALERLEKGERDIYI